MTPAEFKKARQLLEFNASELARRLGVSRWTVARYESGDTAIPTSTAKLVKVWLKYPFTMKNVD